MKTKNLFVLRSVSGAGKTTLAKLLASQLEDCVAIAADDYHYDAEGNYNFDKDNLGRAHEWCKSTVALEMNSGTGNIIVHNTNTTAKEIKPYVEFADRFGYNVISLIVENRHGNSNVHDVPDFVLERQENNIKNSLKLS